MLSSPKGVNSVFSFSAHEPRVQETDSPDVVRGKARATWITGMTPGSHAPNTASALVQVVIRRFRPAPCTQNFRSMDGVRHGPSQ
jgi:hypothetical protein